MDFRAQSQREISSERRGGRIPVKIIRSIFLAIAVFLGACPAIHASDVALRGSPEEVSKLWSDALRPGLVGMAVLALSRRPRK